MPLNKQTKQNKALLGPRPEVYTYPTPLQEPDETQGQFLILLRLLQFNYSILHYSFIWTQLNGFPVDWGCKIHRLHPAEG